MKAIDWNLVNLFLEWSDSVFSNPRKALSHLLTKNNTRWTLVNTDQCPKRDRRNKSLFVFLARLSYDLVQTPTSSSIFPCCVFFSFVRFITDVQRRSKKLVPGSENWTLVPFRNCQELAAFSGIIQNYVGPFSQPKDKTVCASLYSIGGLLNSDSLLSN